MNELWRDEPQLLNYHFFEKKEQFEVPVDQNEYWRAFAVEEGEFNYHISDQQGIANAGQLVICPPDILFVRHTKKPITSIRCNYFRLKRDGKKIVFSFFDSYLHYQID